MIGENEGEKILAHESDLVPLNDTCYCLPIILYFVTSLKPPTDMKKVILIAFTISLLTSCGSNKSGTKIGQEVCDCSKKANAMDPADPKRAEAQKDCAIKQVDAWNKVKDNQKRSDEFNKVLSDCASEQIKKAFGK
jgi:hypothetical protein